MPFRSVSSLLLSSLTIVNEGSSLTIVNDGLSLTIVNETTNFIKTVVFKNDRFVFVFFVVVFITKRSFFKTMKSITSHMKILFRQSWRISGIQRQVFSKKKSVLIIVKFVIRRLVDGEAGYGIQ